MHSITRTYDTSYLVTILITFIVPVVICFVSPHYRLCCAFHLSHVSPILVIFICVIIHYPITTTTTV